MLGRYPFLTPSRSRQGSVWRRSGYCGPSAYPNTEAMPSRSWSSSAWPRTTVLLPVYNAIRWLPFALHSLAGQTLEDFRVMIVDDGSRDGTAELVDRWCGDDERFLSIHLSTRRGIAYALNRGLAACHSPFIARMDADDQAAPQRLEVLEERLISDQKLMVLGSAAHVIPRHGQSWVWRPPLTHADIIRLMPRRCPLLHPSTIMRRALLLRLGGYRVALRHTEDQDLWLRAAVLPGVRFANHPEPLLQYRLPHRHSWFRTCRTTAELVLLCWRHRTGLAGGLQAATFPFYWLPRWS